MRNPAVVVVGYNRARSIARLLSSLDSAVYTDDVTLVISIDKSKSDDVYHVANSYRWKYGEKRIIHHAKNLGLRDHILRCGDLAYEYGSVIILEDDLFISPHFYSYAANAIKYYQDDSAIAGISLYNHLVNPLISLPFTPLIDDSDIYFLKFASSWGQAWTSEQWRGFRGWYDEHSKTLGKGDIPRQARAWPDSSWLKYYIAYMNKNNKYFVYPRHSLSTNFCDKGVHYSAVTSDIYQVPLLYMSREIKLKPFAESLAVYDSWFEIEKNVLDRLSRQLSGYNYDVDLNGNKDKDDIMAEYLITTRKCKNVLKSYSPNLKPAELNIVMDLGGEGISLARIEDVDFSEAGSLARYSEYIHYYPLPKIRSLIMFALIRIREKIREVLNR